jgi:hypothetical protein
VICFGVCSLYRQCKVVAADTKCSKMGLTGNICSNKFGETMSVMRGCRFYNVLCNSQAFSTCNCSGSFPTPLQPSCEQNLSQNLPSTLLAQQRVRSICNAVSQNHLSCDKCTGTGGAASVSSPCLKDPLDVLSDLCTSYKDNEGCTEWKTWCANNAGPVRDSYCARSVNASLIKPAAGGAASLRRNAGSALAAVLVASLLPLRRA